MDYRFGSSPEPSEPDDPRRPRPDFSPVDAFKQLVQIPTYTSAAFLDPVDIDGESDSVAQYRFLHLGLSCKVLHREAKISLTQDYSLLKFPGSRSRVNPLVRLPQQELPAGHTEFFAPGGHLKGVLVTRDKERYIEVWDLARQSLLVGKKVTKEVGRFIADEQWGQPVFSPNSQKLLFVAYPPPDDPAEPAKSALERFRFTPTWGELQRDLTSPEVFLFDFTKPSAPTVRPLLTKKQQGERSFGQAQFGRGDGGEGVVCVGFEPMEDERRLGVVYCTNRRSSLWWFPLAADEQEGTQLTPESRSARSPRVLSRRDAPGVDTLVWLSNPLGGPHNSCATLHCAPLKASCPPETDILIDVVEEPDYEAAEESVFPGLYLNALPSQPFLFWSGRHRLALSSIRFSHLALYVVDIPGVGEPVVPSKPLYRNKGEHSDVVLGTDGRVLVAVASSNLVASSGLEVLNVGPYDAESEHCWHVKTLMSNDAADLLCRYVPRMTSLPNERHVQTLSLHRTSLDFFDDDSARKLLLVPHGGPHSTSLNSFSPAIAAFALAGYEVALVNYTGSLGVGQKWVDQLVGECGVRDVADCWAVIEAWKAKLRPRQTGKVFVLGGSHGGYLAAHLTSQYPEAFTAAVLRNPVVSLGENLIVTDIPDWVLNELGLSYPLESTVQRPSITPTAEQYAFLQSRSPIGQAQAVTAHTLVLMGEGDRRVPPSQSKAWYHSLKGKSAWAAKTGGSRLDVECLAFPSEGHALDGVVAELACFEATLEWFERHAGDGQ